MTGCVAAKGSGEGRGGPDGEGGSRGSWREEKEGRRPGGSTVISPGMVPACVKLVAVVVRVGVESGEAGKEAEEEEEAGVGKVGCDDEDCCGGTEGRSAPGGM